jgi:glutathione S-transferase
MTDSSHKLVVHHLNNSRSQRILWLLVRLVIVVVTYHPPVPADTKKKIFLLKEELEVPYEIKFYQREANQLAPKELLNVNPLGKAPVITDGDVNLAESGAIIRA